MQKQIKTKDLKLNNFFYLTIPSIFVILGIFLFPKPGLVAEISVDNIINLTNKERTKQGISELKINNLLSNAAKQKGLSILESQTFAHDINNKKFSQWITEAGYKYAYVGENLAIDFNTSEGVIKAWLNSPTHKKNLLNNSFTEIGVAIIEGNFEDKESAVVVQIFGLPLLPSGQVLGNSQSGKPILLTTNNVSSASNAATSFYVKILNQTNFSNLIKMINNIFQIETLFILAIALLLFQPSLKNLKLQCANLPKEEKE